MLLNRQDPLYAEFADYISSKSVCDAFHILIGAGAAHPKLTCGPERKGVVRDFRFFTDELEQPFAFIVNKQSLLFYMRLPAVRTMKWSRAELQSQFSEVTENNVGEWTIRVSNREEAIQLVDEVINAL